ncbi:TFIIE alpha subunit-domain-containing protein [Armillaria novae-zelandiae]|uniref:TFIIE alpha subunit-domain-containing protein n=1 Tax=Armillaria novae-zelandiae TaxID=153914 RepID=A0AA39UFR9_9AGAR|nr:TFIIE alpha subunit-domain-containing protein [Armillaria novae-zelandiae]
MATKEDQETLRQLVLHVSRAFYKAQYIIIMDQLSRHPVLKDDDLASRLGLQSKELNKIVAVLSNDKLVKVYRQNELREGAQRAVGKQYYYIDYEHFCNVVKWRIAKMHHKIDSKLRNQLGNKGYICPQCKESYSALDADQLMDFTRGIMVCKICQAEVIDNEDADHEQGSKDRMLRFHHQMRFIRAGLQKSETMTLPAFDVAAWVQSNAVDPEKQKATQAGGGLKIAGSDPNKKEEDGIGVVISTDKDEATRKLERDAEAEAKRQQNALPAWHLKSTITGDLTALGIKENARAEVANGNAAPSSNDDILRGLGVVGMRPDRVPEIISAELDVKPTINREAEYYEQYYASLAASAAASAQATPSGLSAPGSSDFDDFGEEEDRKPNIEYLDSLNDYRKRSRSREDEGVTGKVKVPKVEEVPTPYIMNGDISNTGTGPDPAPMDADNDPVVYVNGKPVAFSKVTEEDHELMTPEEYTAYFEVMQAQEM